MSDATINTLINAVVTVISVIAGVVALWLKMQTGHQNLVQKVDENTELTRQAADTARELSTEIKKE